MDEGAGATTPVWAGLARDVGDRPGDQPTAPDLATWAWHRATSAAVGVVGAALLGSLLGGLGALVAGAVAALVAYVVGPCSAGLERVRFPGGTPTVAELRVHWGGTSVATMVGLIGLGVVVEGTDGLGLALWVLVPGVPIAVAATIGAIALGPRLDPRVARPLAVGVPAALLGAIAWEATRPLEHTLGVVDGALVLAVAVLVPLAVPLAVRGDPEDRTALGLLAGVTGTWAAAGVVLEQGATAVVVTLPWLVVVAGLALGALDRWLQRRGAWNLGIAVASGYLAVGACWLVADRADLEPGGFGPPFVQLTAVHFTYAGAVGTLLALLAWRHRRGPLTATAVLATAAGPPLVAAGFVAFGPLQIAGASVLTVGTYATAAATVRHVVPTVGRPARVLLTVSAVSVVAPMLLAVQWAVGANLGTPALSIPAMAATHGVANAVGFCGAGVLGWRAAVGDRSPRGDEAT